MLIYFLFFISNKQHNIKSYLLDTFYGVQDVIDKNCQQLKVIYIYIKSKGSWKIENLTNGSLIISS